MTVPPSSQGSGSRGPSSTQYVNNAGGWSHVGAQFGVVHGNVTLYYYSDGTPEQQFETGLRNLQSGAASEAEKLIDGAISRGLTSNRVWFYYALSVASGKSIEKVLRDNYEKLDRAFSNMDPTCVDDFLHGLKAISAIIRCVLEQETRGVDPGGDTLIEALSAFDGLPDARRRELARHLDALLSGVLLEEIDERERHQVETGRFAGDRRKRIHKFFIPDPRHPVKHGYPAGRWGGVDWIVAGSLGAGFLFGYGTLWYAATRAESVVPVLSLLLALPGSLGLAWGWGQFGAAAEIRRRRIQRYEHTHGVSPDPWAPNAPREMARRFTWRVYQNFERAFEERRPRDVEDGRRWDADTRGIRVTLTNEIIWAYGHADLRSPERLDWIARHHANEIAAQWAAGSFNSYRKYEQGSWLAVLLLSLGLIGALTLGVWGLVLMLVAAPGSAALGLLFWGLVVFGAGSALVPRYARHVWAIGEVRRIDELFDKEYSAFALLEAFLADRPADSEMAAWLDADLRWIKISALKFYDLKAREVVQHLILTEAADDCLRARAAGAPARYSHYIVRVFLLTSNGVRLITTEIDSLTGVQGSQERYNFQYDKLASANVHEVGVRFSGRKREVVPVERFAEYERSGHSLVLSQAFRLTLVSGTSISVLIENYDKWVDALGAEDYGRLIALAMESSGVSTALHTLEAVAAEGREWIEMRRARYFPDTADRVDRMIVDLGGAERRSGQLPDDPVSDG